MLEDELEEGAFADEEAGAAAAQDWGLDLFACSFRLGNFDLVLLRSRY